MNEQEYLKSVGFSDLVISKVKSLRMIAEKMCPEPINDMVVNEYRKSNGEPVLNSVLFFSKKYMLESRNVLSEELRLDIACHYKSIERCEITCFDFNPLEPDKITEKSRLSIEGNFGDVFFQINATRANCKTLLSIHNKHVLPNVIEILEIEG